MRLLKFKEIIAVIGIFLISSVANAQNKKQVELPLPVKTYQVIGANDVRIAVQEWGVATGDVILFSHSWTCNYLGWLPQITGDLAKKYRIITYDLRGHGNSEKPLNTSNYNNSDVWADDVNAIINHLDLDKITLVGWSYSSVVVFDYIQKYGADKVHAVNVVGGMSAINVERAKDYFGHGADPSSSISKKTQIQAKGMVEFINTLTPESLDRNTYGLLLASAMVVPTEVRLAMLQRSTDHKETYEKLTLPVLFSHGDEDPDIKLVAAEEGAQFVKEGKLSVYKGVNHGPHWADPERFDKELSELIEEAK